MFLRTVASGLYLHCALHLVDRQHPFKMKGEKVQHLLRVLPGCWSRSCWTVFVAVCSAGASCTQLHGERRIAWFAVLLPAPGWCAWQATPAMHVMAIKRVLLVVVGLRWTGMQAIDSWHSNAPMWRN